MGTEDKALAEQIKQGKSWEWETVSSWKMKCMVLGVMCILLAALAVIALIAVMLMAPLKRIETYYIELDKVSGLYKVIQPSKDEQFTVNTALMKGDIAKYVRERESYLYDTFKRQLEIVQRMSDIEVATAYMEEYSPNRETSPYERIGAGKIEVDINSITFFGERSVRVSIVRSEIHAGRTETYQEEIALTFRYSQEPIEEADLLDNPLGFLVTNYSKSNLVIQ